ncbi:MAG: outer membrane beta-barrel protein [Gammaproteobacteria bacterium]|nr:outer membrane beta-barrel protein [Gammaproteobacteria bacterium]
MQANYQLSYQGEYSSNAKKSGATTTNVQGVADYLSVFRGELGLKEASGRFRYDVTSAMELRHYANGSYKPDAVLMLDATSNWLISPRRFEWTFENYLGESQIRVLNANTPDNRQFTNTFVTGPSITLRFGKTDNLVLNARFSDDYEEVTNNAAQRANASLEWGHRISLLSSISATISSTEVKYKDLLSNRGDSKALDAFIGFQTQRARSTFSLDLGESRGESDRRGTTSNALGRLAWAYQMSASSQFSLSAAQELTDSGRRRVAVAQQGAVVANPVVQVASSGVFESRRLNFSFSQGWQTDSVNFSAYAEQQDYLNDPADVAQVVTTVNKISGRDSEVFGFDASWSHSINRRLDVAFNGSYSLSMYPTVLSPVSQTVREDTNQSVGLSLQYQWGRFLALTSNISQSERDSNEFGQDYQDTRFSVAVTYGR